MIARELPSDEVLASWQHVEQRALDLRAAGIPGTLEELRVRAYLDLLQERRTGLPVPGPGPAGADGGPRHRPAGHRPRPGRRRRPGWQRLRRPAWRGCRAEPGRAGQHHRAVAHADRPVRRPSRGRRVRHRRRRRRPRPGRRSRPRPPHPLVRHRAAPRRHRRRPRLRTRPPPPARHRRLRPRRSPGPTPARPRPDPPPGSWPQDWISGLHITMTPIARGSCDHHHAEAGYRPSRKLRHLVRARNTRCTAPGCGRPAARCDVDHTIAWDHGGLTCECDLAPLCRHHHRCKQAEGWQLEQPQPGVLIWHTPRRTHLHPPHPPNTSPSSSTSLAAVVDHRGPAAERVDRDSGVGVQVVRADIAGHPRLSSRMPATTITAAMTRVRPNGSRKASEPMIAPKMTLVSRSAAIGASAPRVCAQSTRP